MRAVRLALFAGTIIVGACRTHAVSVVVPEQGPDVADLAPISARGDTSWRASAARDMASHSGGPHVSANTSATAPPATRRVAPPAPPTGLAALSPELVNAAPAASDLDDDEGSAILHAQVLLDRARWKKLKATGSEIGAPC